MFFFVLLIVMICLMMAWGFLRPQNPYQFPFLMAAITLVFLLPQSIMLNSRPEYGMSTKCLHVTYLMTALCLLMACIGYSRRLKKKFFLFLTTPDIAENRMFYGAVVYAIAAYYFQYLIKALPTAALQGTTEGGATGIVTKYIFFRSLIYPAFAISLLYALKRKKIIIWLITFVMAWLPLSLIIFSGRREVTAIFLLTIGLACYFRYKWCPPKLLIGSLLIFTLIAIPLISIYRNVAAREEWSDLREINFKEEFLDYIERGEALELTNAVFIIQYCLTTGTYGYGKGYWDDVVFSFVPAQFTGEKFKYALMSKKPDYFVKLFFYYFNYTKNLGATTTGIADAFFEFGYLGCLFFYFLGYFFKHLWAAVTTSNNMLMQVFYIQLLSPAMLAITHGTVTFLPHLIYQIIFLSLLYVFAKRRKRYYRILPVKAN